jgi:hypothetical protein
LSDPLPRNDGISTTVGETLMAPTVIYVKQVGFCLFIYILCLRHVKCDHINAIF